MKPRRRRLAHQHRDRNGFFLAAHGDVLLADASDAVIIAFNVIADSARLSGTLRCFDRAVWEMLPGAVEEIAGGVAAAVALAALPGAGVRLRPRALTTTLLARTVLSDLFLHGIGEIIARKVVDGLDGKSELIDDLLQAGIKVPRDVLVLGGNGSTAAATMRPTSCTTNTTCS